MPSEDLMMKPLRVLVVEDNPADIDLLQECLDLDDRSDAELRHVPVVILTHSDTQSEILNTDALGANCYITKPSTLHGFRQVVHQLEDSWFGLVKLPVAAPSPSPR